MIRVPTSVALHPRHCTAVSYDALHCIRHPETSANVTGYKPFKPKHSAITASQFTAEHDTAVEPDTVCDSQM